MLSYLRWDDVKQVSCRRIFLAEHVALLGLEHNVQNFDDKWAAAQSSHKTVFTQETAQLCFVFIHVLQGQFSAWNP